MSIEEDLEQALDVDPSPEFVARVRQRIAREPMTSVWWRPWQVVAASAVLVALAVIVGLRYVALWQPPTVTRIAVSSNVAQPSLPPLGRLVLPDDISAAGEPSRLLPVVGRATGPVVAGGPTAVGVQRDVEALRRFVSMVRDGRYPAVELDDARGDDLAPLSVAAIEVEPLVVEPLAAIVPLGGGL